MWVVALKLGVVHLILSTAIALPNVDIPLEVVVIPVGGEALLECTVRELGNNTVLWTKVHDGSGIPETLTAGNVRISPDARISVIHENGGETWLLSIKPTSLSDSARYVCEVNAVPPIKVYMSLKVEEKKQIPSLNYTDCCLKNRVPPYCLAFCNFDAPLQDTTQGSWDCYAHLQTITSCLTDGRDHTPCCVREQIPGFCRSVCRGDYKLLTVVEHYNCSKYALPTLACIAGGLEILPGPPKEISAEALSPTRLRVQWQPPHQPVKVTHYQINVTQLHEFDENGMLRVMPENNRESKELSVYDDEEDQSDNILTFKVDGNSTFYIIENLNPLTMYEITAVSQNEHGSSIPTYSLRTVTPSPYHVDRIPTNQSNVTLPDVPACCRKQGVQLGRCLRILCDPSRADETRMTDIMICAPWANVTFECMAGGFDHSPCCRERGVPELCLEFCSGTIKRVDYRHFICVEYMPQYGSCLLDHYGVISSPPENFTLTTVDNQWALLRWDQPETLGDTVQRYNLHWRNVSDIEDLGYYVTTDVHSPYLLDGLSPGKRYEAYVVAENSYGVSDGSSRVVFSTVPLSAEPEIETNITTYNETKCCYNAGLPGHCMPLCSYQMKIRDLDLLGPLCFEHLHILLRCGAGGHDHTPCCERRFVYPQCLPLCAGTNSEMPPDTAFICETDLANIIQCMVEGNEILPDIPVNFEVTAVTPTSIHIQWDPPANNRSETFRVYYEKLGNSHTLHPANYSNDINVSSTNAILENLEPGTRYSIYVVSANSHGYSLPSSVLIASTTVNGRNDTTIKATLSPPYEVEVTFETADTIVLSWKPPLHVPPDAFLSYIVYYQLANSTTDLAHDGNTIATVLPYIALKNLSVNTEYAIAIRARTGQGESDLSEVLLTWTDPALPSLAQPPIVIPMGSILEGSNITILCIGSGMPVPNVSVYVNGQLMKEEKRRHVDYTIVQIQRNVTSVACYVDNGYGHGSQSWRDITVGFKATANTAIKSVKGYEGQPVRLQCVVSGHPEPRITWYRDAEEQQIIKAGPGVKIQSTQLREEPSSYLASLLLNEVTKSDEGDYYCKAENRFGSSTVSLELKLNAHGMSSNITECCIKEGVTDHCLGACPFDVDIQFAINRPFCLSDVNKIMVCAADGSDHQQCCRRRGVPKMCTKWCRGYPVFQTSTCVLLYAREIVNCFEEGRSVLPGIVQNVNAELRSDRAVYLQWEPPMKNHKVVQWYRVFWRPVGTKDVYRNQTAETHFKIQDLKPGLTYEIFVKAGNHYGQSQSTNPAVIYITPTEEVDSNVAVKIAIGIVVTVLLLVLIGIVFIYFKLRYRPNIPKGISFENPTYMKESFNLQNASGERIDNGSAIDNIQKSSESQRAVANIYEEPKPCGGQQG